MSSKFETFAAAVPAEDAVVAVAFESFENASHRDHLHLESNVVLEFYESKAVVGVDSNNKG